MYSATLLTHTTDSYYLLDGVRRRYLEVAPCPRHVRTGQSTVSFAVDVVWATDLDISCKFSSR